MRFWFGLGLDLCFVELVFFWHLASFGTLMIKNLGGGKLLYSKSNSQANLVVVADRVEVGEGNGVSNKTVVEYHALLRFVII